MAINSPVKTLAKYWFYVKIETMCYRNEQVIK